MGYVDRARAFAEHNLADWRSTGTRRVLVVDPHDYTTFTEDYPAYFGDDYDVEIVLAVDLVAELVHESRLELTVPVERVATYHDACRLNKRKGIHEAPREILRAIPGLTFKDVDRVTQWSYCSGAGGGLSVECPDLTAEISRRRVERAAELDVDLLVSACVWSERPLGEQGAGLERPLEVRDLMELVAQAAGFPPLTACLTASLLRSSGHARHRDGGDARARAETRGGVLRLLPPSPLRERVRKCRRDRAVGARDARRRLRRRRAQDGRPTPRLRGHDLPAVRGQGVRGRRPLRHGGRGAGRHPPRDEPCARDGRHLHEESWQGWIDCKRAIAEATLRHGGSISAAHGSTRAGDVELVPLELGASFELMKIKRTLDPNNVMNPGKYLLGLAYED